MRCSKNFLNKIEDVFFFTLLRNSLFLSVLLFICCALSSVISFLIYLYFPSVTTFLNRGIPIPWEYIPKDPNPLLGWERDYKDSDGFLYMYNIVFFIVANRLTLFFKEYLVVFKNADFRKMDNRRYAVYFVYFLSASYSLYLYTDVADLVVGETFSYNPFVQLFKYNFGYVIGILAILTGMVAYRYDGYAYGLWLTEKESENK